MYKGVVFNYKRGGGGVTSEVLLLQHGGGDFLAILKGGAKSYHSLKGGGWAQRFILS